MSMLKCSPISKIIILVHNEWLILVCLDIMLLLYLIELLTF